MLPPEPFAMPSPTRPVIMLVDDDADLLGLLRSTLEKEGYRVEARTSAPGRQDILDVDPSMIFMDVGLSEENGAALCRAIKEDLGASLPVVLMHIRFLPATHTFTQVSEETRNANGSEFDGNYDIGPGVDSATVELAGSGTIYHVCVPHADMAMKGIVHVSIAAGVDDRDSGPSVLLFPNPAHDEVRSAGLPPAMLSAVLTDASGRTVLRKALHTASPLNVEAVPTGAYGLRLIDATGATVLQRRLTVAR